MTVYGCHVTKTTLDVDDTLVERARIVLGTRGLNDTIDAALREVLVHDARRAFITRLKTREGLDLEDESLDGEAWGD
jgi:Arc/MetJ family transcription regulator